MVQSSESPHTPDAASPVGTLPVARPQRRMGRRLALLVGVSAAVLVTACDFQATTE